MSPLTPPVRAFWWGVLHAIGMFDSAQPETEETIFSDNRTWFCLGEAGMSALLAGLIAVPAGSWFAGRADLSLAFIGAAVVFLPLFVFLPRIIRRGMQVDTDSVIGVFENDQIQKVFWTLFAAMAGLVLAQVLDPATARQIVGLIAGVVP